MSLWRSDPSGFLPRSLRQWMLKDERSTPASTNGRMLSRTPSLRVRLPTDRLLVQCFHRTWMSKRLLALEDRLELALQLQRRRQPRLRTSHLVTHLRPLALHPVLTEIRVGQFLQRLAIEPVVVHERREPIP